MPNLFKSYQVREITGHFSRLQKIKSWRQAIQNLLQNCDFDNADLPFERVSTVNLVQALEGCEEIIANGMTKYINGYDDQMIDDYYKKVIDSYNKENKELNEFQLNIEYRFLGFLLIETLLSRKAYDDIFMIFKKYGFEGVTACALEEQSQHDAMGIVCYIEEKYKNDKWVHGLMLMRLQENLFFYRNQDHFSCVEKLANFYKDEDSFFEFCFLKAALLKIGTLDTDKLLFPFHLNFMETQVKKGDIRSAMFLLWIYYDGFTVSNPGSECFSVLQEKDVKLFREMQKIVLLRRGFVSMKLSGIFKIGNLVNWLGTVSPLELWESIDLKSLGALNHRFYELICKNKDPQSLPKENFSNTPYYLEVIHRLDEIRALYKIQYYEDLRNENFAERLRIILRLACENTYESAMVLA